MHLRIELEQQTPPCADARQSNRKLRLTQIKSPPLPDFITRLNYFQSDLSDSQSPNPLSCPHPPSAPHAAPSYDPGPQNARRSLPANISCISAPKTCTPGAETRSTCAASYSANPTSARCST